MFGGLVIRQNRFDDAATVIAFEEFGKALDYFVDNEADRDLKMELYKRQYRPLANRTKVQPRYQLIRHKDWK